MAYGSSKQRSASECNKHTVENMCRQTTRFSHVCSALFSSFTFLLSLSLNSRKIVYFQFPKIPLTGLMYLHDTFNDFVVVALLFYVHGKHQRSCRDGQLT